VIVSLRQAVAEYDSDNPAVAERLLLQVLETSPAAYDPVLGSAAYWLGVLYWEQGRRPEALDIWQSGWIRLSDQGRVDLLLGDRLLWSVFDENDETRFETASSVYLTLLERTDAAEGERVAAVASRILGPLRLVLPDSLRDMSAGGYVAGVENTFSMSGVGVMLADWWRGMDVIPATARNERLIEHLRRTAWARKHYGVDEDGGIDDRGSVYIRFGPALRKTETRLNPFDIGGPRISTPEAIRTDLSAATMTFPRNEFWVYPQVDQYAQFLFVERRPDEYRLGTTSDLIPGHLRTPRHARTLLKVLETVLRPLALHHSPTYGAWYEEVASQLTELELSEISARLNRPGSGSPGWSAGDRIPLVYTHYNLVHSQMTERLAIRTRDREIPEAFFDDFGPIEDIAFAVREARFLNSDGSTRLEIYWTAPVAELANANARLNNLDGKQRSDFLIEFTVVEYDDRNRRTAHRVTRKRIDGVTSDSEGVLFPQVFTMERLQVGRRLALEWDVRTLSDEEDELLHSQVGMALRRLDSLSTLTDDRRLLEMSDLKPILVNDETGEQGPVYPGSVLTPQVRLGLEFEIYHLRFGGDDRTRYTISYELQRESDPAFKTRARQIAGSQTITSSTDYSGASATETETIVLDLSDWTEPGRMRILVRLRDENSGQEVTRSLDYELALVD
jgi:GWxTD domain-containing protein